MKYIALACIASAAIATQLSASPQITINISSENESDDYLQNSFTDQGSIPAPVPVVVDRPTVTVEVPTEQVDDMLQAGF